MDPPRPARRGRPPMEDDATSNISNDKIDRRTRMRNAQRAYRNRQKMALTNEKAQVEKLSAALGRAMEAFNRFHAQMLQPGQQQKLPQHALNHLSEMAMEMSRIVEDVEIDTDAPDSSRSLVSSNMELSTLLSAPEPRQGLSTKPDLPAVSLIIQTQDSSQRSITSRMFLAFFEYVMLLLTKRFDHERLHTALTIPLQALGKDLLLADLGRISPSPSSGHITEFLYAEHAANRTPEMFRVIEGGGRIVPRKPTPFVQKLTFGKTRTILRTEIPALQGEWLEAPDVEEYLEGRGICLKNGNWVHSPSGTVADQVHEDADWSVFGIMPSSSSIAAGSDGLPVSGPNQIDTRKALHSQAFTPMKIGVDIDKLIDTLTANATCLGPVPGIRRDAVDYAIQQSVTNIEESSD